ncbi:hypothetical protein H2201_003596 [Coniosporium apollinis]|uniref:Enoyl reductase (ER) domain-containing protein n=1 Tax=Coniosporium apollinis TaxID=61459 RepID=A0ABQ9NXD6_9PEZI|nr:hypothetical protein H2201_003596 [Coniosporium apollinis]
MKAIVVSEFGGPEVLTPQTVPTPTPQPGYAIIRIKAFGVNHAEMHMRRGEWAEAMPIIGIECVEYTKAPVRNVVALGQKEEDVDMEWGEVAAIPESYATAWTCLFRNLEVKEGQRLLIRGATSAFGQAAINLAVQAGVDVVGTTRKEERFEYLRKLGVKDVWLEGSNLSQRIADAGMGKFDAVLELVGNSTLLDSLKLVRRGGRLCLAGFLGGLAPIAEFNLLLQMASGVHFSFFGSFVFGTPEFPLDDVPLESIIRAVAAKKFKAEPSRVFKFDEIQEAHRVMEANAANGKMAVTLE